MCFEDHLKCVGNFPIGVSSIIFAYTFLPYRDLNITPEMVYFLICFFERNLPVNHLNFLKNHLIPLFENYKRKFNEIGRDYWHINEKNFQVDYWKEDIERLVITKEMRLQVYKLNKSRDFFIRKLRKLFPAISYFKDLPLKAGGESKITDSHIFL